MNSCTKMSLRFWSSFTFPRRAFGAVLLLSACTENKLVKKDDGAAPEFDDTTPKILVTPLAVDFGLVMAGRSGAATISISNVGEDTLALDALRFGTATDALTFTDLSTSLLSAGDAVETVITWTPTSAGVLSNTLDVGSNDPDQPLVQVDLGGSVPHGNLTVTPDLYDFGSLAVGDEATVTLTVANDGLGPVTVSDWEYIAGDADLHVLDAGGLTALPLTLEAGASTQVIVEYTPSGAGSDDGSFGVTSDDEDEPLLVVQQYGNATDPDPCHGLLEHVSVTLTADDSWRAWVDGTEFVGVNAGNWYVPDTYEADLPCGDHALSVYATDIYGLISGLIAYVQVDGVTRFVSGPSDWRMIDAAPSADWTDAAFDDSAWHIPQVCASNAPWGTTPQPFYDQGAEWIWWDSNCDNLGEAWFRLDFSVP